MRFSLLLPAVLFALGAAGCDASTPAEPTPSAPTPPPETPSPSPAVTPSTETTPRARPQEDVERDAARKPQAVMDFFGIEAGSRVVELMSGRGYYAELILGRVGPKGEVWAHNNRFVMERFARGPLEERMKRLDAPNLHVLESELHDPKLPEGLDAVMIVLFYHDTYWQEVDRKAMNAAVFSALEPGGVYGVVDHHAEAGSRARDVKSIHRVDMELVKKEILDAGFVLDASSDLLARPDDDRSQNVFEMRGETDRFVLRFVKPS